jgi:hypothetical protein
MDNLDVIRNFVTSPLVESLLFTHPNDLSVAVARPALPFREPWWAWAADAEACRWMQLFEYYTDPIQRTVCPFRSIVNELQPLEGLGHSGSISRINRPSLRPGASPKSRPYHHWYYPVCLPRLRTHDV